MSSTDCVRVGHKLSFTTGTASGLAKAGEWCLVMYTDNDCKNIHDHRYLQLDDGHNQDMCFKLERHPYHGSYHWARVDAEVSTFCHTRRRVIEMRKLN